VLDITYDPSVWLLVSYSMPMRDTHLSAHERDFVLKHDGAHCADRKRNDQQCKSVVHCGRLDQDECLTGLLNISLEVIGAVPVGTVVFALHVVTLSMVRGFMGTTTEMISVPPRTSTSINAGLIMKNMN
jgi:hypothetical protein